MKSLERRFRAIVDRSPYWSSFVCFAVAVSGQRFSKPILSRWFHKLVRKDVYEQGDKNALLSHLDGLSNPARTAENGTQTDHQRA